jgi:hypothetical protein
MFMVVPVEEPSTEAVGILLGAKAVGKLRPILQRLKLAFRRARKARKGQSMTQFGKLSRYHIFELALFILMILDFL